MALGLISSKKKDDGNDRFLYALQSRSGIPEGGVPTPTDANPFGNVGYAINAPGAVEPVANPGVKEFAFNPKYDILDQENDRRLNEGGLRRRNSLQSIDQMYQQQTDDAGKIRNESIKRLQERMASQGILNSTITLDETGDIEEDYGTYIGRLGTARGQQIQGAENDYANLIAQINNAREGMFFNQGQEEEQLRLDEERRRAEGEAARLQAEQEAERLRRLEESIAAIANQPPPAPVSYSPPNIGSIGGGDYGGGGYQEEAPAPVPAPAQDRVVMPVVQGPSSTTGRLDTPKNVEWVHKHVDPWVQGVALQKVIEVLGMAGQNGVPREDLAWLIKHYSGTSGGDKPYNAGGGVRVK